jgi:hypothetical protein
LTSTPRPLAPRFLILLCALAAAPVQAEKQVLWGYGVRGCADFTAAAAAADAGDFAEYQRYEDWLTGLISGLNLATGTDVLSGSGIETAMRRTRQQCDKHPADDFFNASMRFVRSLSTLR